MDIQTVILISAGALVVAIIGATWFLGNWHGSVNKSIENLIDEFKYLRGRIDEMFTKQAGQVSDSNSPQRLNDTGKNLSKAFDSAGWARSHVDHVRGEVAGMTPYDVQEFCFAYVTEDKFTEEELIRAKEVAFDNGMLVSHVLRVTAFELRDLLLSEKDVDGL